GLLWALKAMFGRVARQRSKDPMSSGGILKRPCCEEVEKREGVHQAGSKAVLSPPRFPDYEVAAGEQDTKRRRTVMAKVIFGNHSSVIVPQRDRNSIRKFYCDVLGGVITKDEK